MKFSCCCDLIHQKITKIFQNKKSSKTVLSQIQNDFEKSTLNLNLLTNHIHCYPNGWSKPLKYDALSNDSSEKISTQGIPTILSVISNHNKNDSRKKLSHVTHSHLFISINKNTNTCFIVVYSNIHPYSDMSTNPLFLSNHSSEKNPSDFYHPPEVIHFRKKSF